MDGLLILKNNFIIFLESYKMLFTSERERLLNVILSQSNSDTESITLENFNDMSEDDLRSIVLIGEGRIRHAYRPESLYSQYVTRRGVVRDPQNPSYTLSQNELNNVFNQMRQRYPDFQPQVFTEERPIQNTGVKMLIEDDDIPLNNNEEDIPIYTRNTQSRGNHLGSQNPHPLLSGRNSFLDELEREFNDMVNRQYTNEKKPYEYCNDKGKGPGGFPMRGNSSNVGMPAKEPLFEPHRILLYDPDHRFTPSKTRIHSLAYTYQFSPYGNAPIEIFSPGNSKGDSITSEKMPEWMTVDPMKRDKVTFIQEKPKEIKHNYPESSYIQEYIKQPQEDKPKKWWLVVALLLFIFIYSKKR
jgi:hypothetical protein